MDPIEQYLAYGDPDEENESCEDDFDEPTDDCEPYDDYDVHQREPLL